MGVFRFLSDDDIKNLIKTDHTFFSAGPTLLDRILDPYWSGIARLIPRWISPNMISLFGGSCAALACPFSVWATRSESSILYYVAPMLLFLYMTADGVDGKHARGTHQCSPLGAIVDHGIDAFCAFTTGLAVVNTVCLKLPPVPAMMGYCMFHSSWFCAQWGELHLHKLDQRGITEGEFATMLVLVLPALAGADVFSWPIPWAGSLELGVLVLLGVLFGCGAVCISFVARVMWHDSNRCFEACKPLIHLCLHNVIGILLAGTSLGQQNFVFCLAFVGMDAAILMTKIRFAATFHSRWPLVHIDMLPFMVVGMCEICGFSIGFSAYVVILCWQLLYMVGLWMDTIPRVCSIFGLPFLAPLQAEKTS